MRQSFSLVVHERLRKYLARRLGACILHGLAVRWKCDAIGSLFVTLRRAGTATVKARRFCRPAFIFS